MGVSKNRGTPKKMVKIMEIPIKMDDLGGKPTIFGNTHIDNYGIVLVVLDFYFSSTIPHHDIQCLRLQPQKNVARLNGRLPRAAGATSLEQQSFKMLMSKDQVINIIN